MATVEEGLQAQIRNIEAQYGKSMAEWCEIVKASGITKHNEIIVLLKSQYGMTHGNANRVALIAREADAASVVKNAEARNSDPIAELYLGSRAHLKPVHDRLMALLQTLGDDIEIAPKKGYVSLRRKKQFCMIQPATTRIDLGLILKETPVTERLESAKSFNAMFTHRVRVTVLEEIDDELAGHIQKAYELAG